MNGKISFLKLMKIMNCGKNWIVNFITMKKIFIY